MPQNNTPRIYDEGRFKMIVDAQLGISPDYDPNDVYGSFSRTIEQQSANFLEDYIADEIILTPEAEKLLPQFFDALSESKYYRIKQSLEKARDHQRVLVIERHKTEVLAEYRRNEKKKFFEQQRFNILEKKKEAAKLSSEDILIIFNALNEPKPFSTTKMHDKLRSLALLKIEKTLKGEIPADEHFAQLAREFGTYQQKNMVERKIKEGSIKTDNIAAIPLTPVQKKASKSRKQQTVSDVTQHQKANKKQTTAETRQHPEADKQQTATETKRHPEAGKQQIAAETKQHPEAGKQQIAAETKQHPEAGKQQIAAETKQHQTAKPEKLSSADKNVAASRADENGSIAIVEQPSRPQSKKKEKNKKQRSSFFARAWKWTKRAAVVAGLALFGYLAGKTISSLTEKPVKDSKQNNTEKVVKQKTTTQQAQKQTVKEKGTADFAKERAALEKAYKNRFDTSLKIILGEKARDQLYQKIDRLAQDGKIEYQDGTTREWYAHAFTMYDQLAPNSKENKDIKKLLAGNDVDKAYINSLVVKAGRTGTGIQATGTYSAFDHAPKELQQQHIKSRKAVKQAEAAMAMAQAQQSR